MNNIRVKGKILVLNTIDNLEVEKEVNISTSAIAICTDGRCKLFTKAQFISAEIVVDNYLIPLKKEADGSILLNFEEVRYVFGRLEVQDFDNLGTDWIEYSAVCEKQKTDTDIFSRYPLDDLSGAFWTIMHRENEKKERVDNVTEIFLKKINAHTNITELQTQLTYYKRDFLKIIEESNEYDNQEERQSEKDFFIEKVQPQFNKVVGVLEERIANLKSEKADDMSEEEMQKMLNDYLANEDYKKAGKMRDKMTLKGYTPYTPQS